MANSLMNIVSDGNLSVVPLTIKYLEQAHIKVYVNDVQLPAAGYTFVWSAINTITVTPAVAVGATLSIRRNTPITAPLHEFQAGAVFNELSVDENFQQELFLLQEASEQSLVKDFFTDVNMHGNRITNLGAAVLPTDAVNLAQAQFLSDGGEAGTLRDELASSDGSSMVGVQRGETGAVKRSVEGKLEDLCSIQDFGAVSDVVMDDGVFNCHPALVSGMTALAARGGELRFPKITSGIYRFVGNDTSFTNLSGVELRVDAGVEFRVEGMWTPLIVRGLKVSREVKVTLVSSGYSFYHGPAQYRKPSEVMPTLSQLAGTFEKPVALSGANFIGYTLDTGVTSRQALTLTTSADTVTVPFSSTSQRRVCTIASKPNDEVSIMNQSVAGSVVAGVLTLHGYCVVEQDLNTQAIVLNRNGSFSTVYMPLPTASRNQFNSGMLSVRHISNTHFAVLVNHITLGTFDAGSTITSIAFGAHTRTTDLTFSLPSKVINSKLNGSRPLNIIGIGDSTSDPTIPCSQYDYMLQYLASAGCQVRTLDNMAISGQDSTAQLAAFNLKGLAGVDCVVANIGANDIQGAVPPATYAANVLAMYTRCAANAVQFILSMPTTWYSAVEAGAYGQVGQATANNGQGAEYRLRAMRALAGTSAIISTAPSKHMGLISAAWLAGGTDPVLMDNIHPTAYGRMMMGLGNAMAVLGSSNPTGLSTTINESFPTRWAVNLAPTGRPTVRIVDGTITMRGTVGVTAAPANGTVLIKLDTEFTTGAWQYVPCVCSGMAGVLGLGQLAIDPSGNVYSYNIPVGTLSISMDALSIAYI